MYCLFQSQACLLQRRLDRMLQLNLVRSKPQMHQVRPKWNHQWHTIWARNECVLGLYRADEVKPPGRHRHLPRAIYQRIWDSKGETWASLVLLWWQFNWERSNLLIDISFARRRRKNDRKARRLKIIYEDPENRRRFQKASNNRVWAPQILWILS